MDWNRMYDEDTRKPLKNQETSWRIILIWVGLLEG
jgi:hypothetical protein